MKRYLEVVEQATNLHHAGEYDKAAYLYENLLGNQPTDPAVLYLYGTLHLQLGRFGTAMLMLRQSVDIEPKAIPEAWHNLGAALRNEGHREQSLLAYQRCLTLRPNDAGTLAMMAGSYINAGQPGMAVEYARRALEQDGENPHAHNHLALGLLELGKYKEAWPHYERRYELTGYLTPRPFTCPRWDGKPVRKLAIHGEQGIGDEIMFMSCFEELAKLADEVVVECTPRLTTLFEKNFGVQCYGTADELLAAHPDCDAYLPMGSLPALCRNSSSDFPGTPYLHPDESRVEEMERKLKKISAKEDGSRPYVGIAWYGGTKQTHQEVRNPDMNMFKAVIAQVRELGGTPISVQYGEDGAEQAQELGLPHWKYAVDDMEGQAALVKALDLVISPCQTVIHVAGAVGTDCLCLTPSQPAWRYKTRGDMDWYNSVELLRQKGNDWGSVFDKVKFKLDERYGEGFEMEAVA